ncbi:MAG: MFS transporter [Actinomycetes bacterium]
MSPTFRSMHVRNYRLFASGQIVSLTGTWMQRVAQDWLVLKLTHSGFALGVTTALQFLPMLLFGMYGGLLADRYPKRRVLLLTQVASATFAAALGVLDVGGVVQAWHVYVIAFLLGAVAAVDTPTRQAFVVELVGPSDLPNAIGLNSATFNSARIIGPAVGGLLINAVGTGPVFLINAVSYIAPIVALLAMRDSDLFRSKPVARAKGQARAGLRYVRSRPELLMPIVLVAIVGMFGLNFQMTLALIAQQTFHRGADAYGALSAALALGCLIGALGAARRPRPRHRLLYGAAFAFGVLEFIDAFIPSYWALCLLLVPTGVAILTMTTSANSLCQMLSAPSMRGRVMAVYVLVFLGGTPFGAPLIGGLASVLGPRSSLYIGGAASAVAAAATALVYARMTDVRVHTHLRPRPMVHVRPIEQHMLDEARSA